MSGNPCLNAPSYSNSVMHCMKYDVKPAHLSGKNEKKKYVYIFCAGDSLLHAVNISEIPFSQGNWFTDLLGCKTTTWKD